MLTAKQRPKPLGLFLGEATPRLYDHLIGVLRVRHWRVVRAAGVQRIVVGTAAWPSRAETADFGRAEYAGHGRCFRMCRNEVSL